MEFSRQGYWNELPFPSPGNLSDPGMAPRSPVLQAHALPTELLGKPPLPPPNIYYVTIVGKVTDSTAEIVNKI